MAVPTSSQSKNQKGPRIGWTLGCIGALLWLPALSIVLLFLDNEAPALTGVGFFALGILYSTLLAPWKYPDIPIRRIYAGFGLIIVSAAAAIFILWYPWLAHHTTINTQLPWYVLVLICMPILTIFIPVFTFGRRTWNDIHPNRTDDYHKEV